MNPRTISPALSLPPRRASAEAVYIPEREPVMTSYCHKCGAHGALTEYMCAACHEEWAQGARVRYSQPEVPAAVPVSPPLMLAVA